MLSGMGIIAQDSGMSSSVNHVRIVIIAAHLIPSHAPDSKTGYAKQWDVRKVVWSGGGQRATTRSEER
jgi:hypothetical protein